MKHCFVGQPAIWYLSNPKVILKKVNTYYNEKSMNDGHLMDQPCSLLLLDDTAEGLEVGGECDIGDGGGPAD